MPLDYDVDKKLAELLSSDDKASTSLAMVRRYSHTRRSSTGKASSPRTPAAPYRSDRNEGRLKIKTAQRGRFPIAGFVKDPTGVAALYLGKREGRDLGLAAHHLQPARYASSSTRSRPDVQAHETGQKAQATSVEPSFVAEVEYRDFTSEGLLRESSFKGLSKKG